MKILVGMSGGVDSSVAALLLQLQGHDVTGISMRIYSGSPAAGKQANACYSPDEEQDIEYARNVAVSLGIPFYAFDLKDAYRSSVIDYVAREYCGGKTPNPCVRCNQQVKFSALLDKAAASGLDFDYFATGHYARITYDAENGRYLLQKARDGRRDQSYFLCMLTQEQLGKTLFPLADYTKDMVREIARVHNLISQDRADSQDFAAGSYRQFLPGKVETGYIRDKNNTILGTHNGIGEFTIGQRRGLNVAMGKPLYVTAIDCEHNTVYVGGEDELFKTGLVAADANWISIASLTGPLAVTVKVRSAHAGAGAVIQPKHGTRVRVTFDEPQKALTPGQWAVFYDNDTVVGSAVIEKIL
jgi:tRNA-uridine 2-sulfurtransferase